MKAKYLGVLIGTVCMLSILCSCSGPKTTPDQSVIAHGESTPEARETQEVQEEELQLSEWEQTEWDLAMGSGIVPETLSYQGDITAGIRGANPEHDSFMRRRRRCARTAFKAGLLESGIGYKAGRRPGFGVGCKRNRPEFANLQ